MEFTVEEIDILTNEIISLTNKMNNEFVRKIDSSCSNIKRTFQDVGISHSEIEIAPNLNSQVQELYSDTLRVNDKIKTLMKTSGVGADKKGA